MGRPPHVYVRGPDAFASGRVRCLVLTVWNGRMYHAGLDGVEGIRFVPGLRLPGGGPCGKGFCGRE